MDSQANAIARVWRDNAGEYPAVEPTRRLFVVWMAALYYIFGHHPLLPKLLNGLFSMMAVLLWHRIALLCARPRSALLTTWLLSLWPTHIFYSSHNFRDAPLMLFSALAMYLPLADWTGAKESSPWRTLRSSAALFAVGLFRAHVMMIQYASLLAAAVRARKEARQRAAVTLLGLTVTLAAYKTVSKRIFESLPSKEHLSELDIAVRARLLPVTQVRDGGGKTVSPVSPQGLTKFRRIRHTEDQIWAEATQSRQVQTQIFADAEFHTWMDVMIFLPKSVFYALFMPLPGFYPMDGKLARALASAENVVLLGIALLALAGLRRVRGPAAWASASFFILIALAYGLFEFDLGAATRHRLQYFPCIFPFAAIVLTRESR